MQAKWRAIWLILFAIGCAFEIVAIFAPGAGDTLSELVWSINHPMLGVCIGVVIGHWFWPRKVTGDSSNG